jgi:hypothetical protein
MNLKLKYRRFSAGPMRTKTKLLLVQTSSTKFNMNLSSKAEQSFHGDEDSDPGLLDYVTV